MPLNFNRRSLLAGAAGTALLPVLAPLHARPGARRPNFLFIMADDLGFADLSCYGRRDYATPHLDRLAAQGVRLTNAYANSPVCSATRTALITGRYQYRLPVGLEEPLTEARNIGLPPDQPTLPSLLRAAGYETILVGKWHLGALPDYSPLKSGYNRFWGFREGGVDYFTHKTVSGDKDLWDGDTPIEETGYLTDLLGDRAIVEMERAAGTGRPFLLSLHFSAPHWPWEGPDDTAIAGGLRQLQHWDGGSMKTYAAMVTRMDHQIGRVLAALRGLGAASDTVVVFTSDNGGERFSDTWPFSGRKTELLEGGIRVPAIIRWPRALPRGHVSAQTAMSMDWAPTFLSAAGVAQAPQSPMDGIDLLPLLRKSVAPTDRILFWRYRTNDQRAVRQGKWKYLKIRDNDFLFDLDEDPLERGNRKHLEPGIHTRLTAAFDAWNADMLPLDPESYMHQLGADRIADRYGNATAGTRPATTPAPE